MTTPAGAGGQRSSTGDTTHVADDGDPGVPAATGSAEGQVAELPHDAEGGSAQGSDEEGSGRPVGDTLMAGAGAADDEAVVQQVQDPGRSPA